MKIIYPSICHFVALSFCLLFAFLLPSCKKDPGEGGRATIIGKIIAGNYHSPSTPVTTGDFLADEDVFIIYGDQSTVVNNDTKTSYDGSFSFKYLRPGKYTIFAYSLDTANSSPSVISVLKNIEIQDKKQKLVVDLTVYKEANDHGSSSVRGKVYAKDYSPTFSNLEQPPYYAPDEDVYIMYGDTTGFNDRIRTDAYGIFQFQNLRKGKYTVYAYSRDSVKTVVQNIPNPPDIAKKVSFDITSNNTYVVLPDIVIFK